ncbi:MAG TPA: glycosyltransferase family 39 protein [Burkholderiaceae bacterium]|jgi:4-amino-4-deoxy-L-arabinose transferase-like glycosyltransferase
MNLQATATPLIPMSTVKRPFAPVQAVLVSAAIVVLWALWAAYFNTAQFGDNIEQFNWAQSLELGYHKHPPLPSVALGLMIKLFGPSLYWAYSLATACLLGTLVFTWMIGRELIGDRLSAAAVVLWGLNLSFSQRAQLYNHNTVMVLCIAATVWFAMRATRGHWLWWIATGVGAGAAMLSKYQALVPLAALLLALVLTGRMKGRAAWGGLALALATLAAVFAPHAIWVVRHDYTTLRYAAEAVESANLWVRLRVIVAFLANQVRLAFPTLLAIAICWAWTRRARRGAPKPASDAVVTPDFNRWMIGLTWATLLVLAAMALLSGVSLRNHWGVQALQFLPFWLALQWDRRSPIDLRRLVVVALAVQAVSLTLYAVEHNDPNAMRSSRRIDTAYPARRLALTAVKHWASVTNCPLRFVEGSVFDAGLVSLYSGGQIQVFDSDRATPWIKPEDLQRDGALFVLDPGDPVPLGVTDLLPFALVPDAKFARPLETLTLGIKLPLQPCRKIDGTPGVTGTPLPQSF